ncbi:MAG TPA: hypothetical protein VFQ53_16480 [Kofleriaceae bacterium]|nr:hypothetical protein [Kofleriaceae bacterium]
MLFDTHRSELPVATVRSRQWSIAIAGDLQRWLIARWRWLHPRVVPVVVALAGMVALLGAADYLTALARETPERLPSAQLVNDDADVTTQPAGRPDDDSLRPGTIIELSSGAYYVVPSEPAAGTAVTLVPAR